MYTCCISCTEAEMALKTPMSSLKWLYIYLFLTSAQMKIYCFLFRCLLIYLTVPLLKESTAECLHNIVSKGMEPVPKIELVEGLCERLMDMHILSTVSTKVVKKLNSEFVCIQSGVLF